LNLLVKLLCLDLSLPSWSKPSGMCDFWDETCCTTVFQFYQDMSSFNAVEIFSWKERAVIEWRDVLVWWNISRL